MNAFGLTGGIGSGKSTVASLLGEHPDVLVLDCDHIAKEIISSGADKEDINAFLGADVFPKGIADWRAIARIIFSDPAKKRALETLIHPLVWSAVEEKVAIESIRRICIVESAIIYETGNEDRFPSIIVASCSRKERIRRLKQGRGMKDEDIIARIAEQLPSQEKESRADFVIVTECTLEKLTRKVDRLYRALKQRKE